ncbi:rhodanese-like domain-containing protein [Asticcacaulis machinosus]|uniref:Rhodanese-like domain-containing protein n=1 Tax=Asticcacaulis machinosus TaxID=2984211 RepID=A0ABT5HG51_9CAUL|nr:rhodanese-like domain-containing protein [Asticcacaulis machinosus]MDC7675240.1 rhodanese-like domain-containing protein [Asticcacaulis machinosus]
MSVKSVDALTLKQWLNHNEAILIDVREPSEYAAEHIAGAHLIPLGALGTTPLPDMNGRILAVHCLKGGRGQSACQTLSQLYPDLEIHNLDGGIGAWSAAGFATEKLSPRRTLPLDRQTQLTIGLGILAFTLLSAFVNPLFIWGAAFFGAGLTFAGLTGICGLARVLAHMPWNRPKPT